MFRYSSCFPLHYHTELYLMKFNSTTLFDLLYITNPLLDHIKSERAHIRLICAAKPVSQREHEMNSAYAGSTCFSPVLSETVCPCLSTEAMPVVSVSACQTEVLIEWVSRDIC
jgi:hypothetical protein